MAAQIKTRPIRTAQFLFFLNTTLWLVFGVISIYRIGRGSPEGIVTAWIVAILVFGNAAAMLLSGFLVARPGRLGYYFSLAVLAANLVLTFTDEFGTFDLITLLIDLVLLVVLVAGRRRMGHSTSK